MKIQNFIAEHFKRRLEDCPVLVVYDEDKRYGDIVRELSGDECRVVDGGESTILGRESAMEWWRKIGESDKDDLRLIVYLPLAAPKNNDERIRDPYYAFVLGGGQFPESDGEGYQALCRKAAPDLVPQIDRLFADETPGFETVNSLLKGGAGWPKLNSLLGAESALEILVALLSPSKEQREALEGENGWVPECRRFLKAVLDVSLKTKSEKYSSVAEELWRLVLFGEFAIDLPVALPEALKDVPRASSDFQTLVFSVCDALRSSEKHRENYMRMAEKTASDLDLEKRMQSEVRLGKRDTFAFEERVYLEVFVENVKSDNLEEAREILEQRNRSIWVRHVSERQQLWTIAGRALNLIAAARDLEEAVKTLKEEMEPIFDFYCGRFRRIDERHRDFEQAVSEAYGEFEELEPLVEISRKRYLNLAEPLQAKFMAAASVHGWPVSGRIRNSEVFDRFVAPVLKKRQKIAFFMVDALRYELAAALEGELSARFKTEINPVCATLPTVTSVGMASLTPQADGALRLAFEKDELVPYVHGQRVATPKDRFEAFSKFYGDRCLMKHLDELVSKPKMRIPSTCQLLIVRTSDIDQLGEIAPHEARRSMPRLMRKIVAGVNRVEKKGFHCAVLATDHGFVLLDDRQAGDTVKKPDGEWIAVKDRCLLGKGGSGEGVKVFKKSDIGTDGDFEDYVVPKSFGTFKKGCPYFHEGLSLQECVLPVVSVDFGGGRTEPVNASVEIKLSYKGGATDKITTRRPMIEICSYKEMFEETVEFELIAYAGKEVVGEVAANPNVNPATNLATIKTGQAIKVPLKMAEEYHGEFEVRAVDPSTLTNYHSLKLKTDYLD